MPRVSGSGIPRTGFVPIMTSPGSAGSGNTEGPRLCEFRSASRIRRISLAGMSCRPSLVRVTLILGGFATIHRYNVTRVFLSTAAASGIVSKPLTGIV
jgi:hypothetical protein